MIPAEFPANESERLAKLQKYNILDTLSETEYDDITMLASQICETPIALISFVDAERQWFKSKVGIDAKETPRDLAFCAHAILGEEVFVVPDPAEDKRFFDNPVVTNSPNVKFYAGAPLITPDGFSIGTLCVIDKKPRNLNKGQLEALSALSRSVITLLELRLKLSESQEQLQQIKEMQNENKKIQLEKIESDAIFFDLFENTSDLIQNIRLEDGRFIYVNPSWIKILGYQKEELQNLNFKDIIHPDSLKHCLNIFREAANGNDVPIFEATLISKNGKKIFIQGSNGCVWKNGKPFSTRGIFRDITDYKITELALLDSNAKIRDFGKAINENSIMVFTDQKGIITYANDMFAKISKFSKEELIGKTHKIVNSGFHPKEFFKDMWDIIKTGEVWRGEIKNKAKDGSFYWVDTTIVPFVNLDGDIYQYLAIRRDITKSKIAEQALRESELKFRAVTEMANASIITVNVSGEIVGWNLAAENTFGYSKEEILGKSITIIMPDEYKEAHLQGMENHKSTGEFRVVGKTVELKGLRKNGTIFPLELSLSKYDIMSEEFFTGYIQDISIRKSTELALKQSEAQYRSLVENAPDIIMEIDLDNNIIFINRIVSGLTKDQVIGVNALNFVAPEFRKIVWEKHDRVRRLKQIESYETQFLHPNGSVTWYFTFASPMLLGGEIKGITLITRDISESKHLQQKLIDQNNFIQKVTDSIPALISYWNFDLSLGFANSAYLESIGKKRNDIIGKQMNEILDTTLHQEKKPYMESVLNGETSSFERALPNEDGTLSYTWVQYIPDFQNETVKGFLVLATDINQIKQAEKSLYETQNKLTEILESIPEGIIECNLNLEIVYANKSAERIFEMDLAEIKEHYFDFQKWKRYDKEGNSYIPKEYPIQVAIQKQEEIGPIIQFIENDFGTKKWLSIHAVPLFDKAGNLYGAVATFGDITERQEFQNKIIAAKEEAELAKVSADLANKAKSEFLANISHEIRTPMNAILGFGELLNSKLEEESLKQFASSIVTSGKVLLRLINDVLDLSKIEAGKIELNYAPIHILKSFEEIQIIFSQKVQEKGLDFLIEIDPSLPTMLVLDEMRLRQVLLNLVGNSIKFTEKGYVKVSVSKINTNESNQTIDLIIGIDDTGIGIPEVDKEKIFEAFAQTAGQNQEKYGGTGLGLTIARKLVTLMNGEITLSSKVGVGTTFAIVLRNLKVINNPNLVSVKTVDSIKLNADIQFEPSIILLVDDVSLNRELIIQFLKKYPELKIIEAENGKIAIDMANEYKPDLILMDIKMPVMNGLEAIQIIKKIDSISKTPIIALTASAFEKTKLTVTAITDGYIQKPVSRQELLLILSTFLKKKEPIKTIPKINSLDNIDIPLKTNFKRSKELYQRITQEKIQQCKELLDVLDITESINFGSEMQLLGKEFNYEPLIKWGNDLEKYARQFDSNNINSILKKFEHIIKELQD